MDRILPYLVFLLCPLIHLMMMRAHGRNQKQQPAEAPVREDRKCH